MITLVSKAWIASSVIAPTQRGSSRRHDVLSKRLAGALCDPHGAPLYDLHLAWRGLDLDAAIAHTYRKRLTGHETGCVSNALRDHDPTRGINGNWNGRIHGTHSAISVGQAQRSASP